MIRIPGTEVQAKSPEWKGKTGHVVLRNGLTHHGRIHQTPEGLQVTDPNLSWYSSKKHRHVVKWEEIFEIVLDKAADW